MGYMRKSIKSSLAAGTIAAANLFFLNPTCTEIGLPNLKQYVPFFFEEDACTCHVVMRCRKIFLIRLEQGQCISQNRTARY